MPDQRWAAHGCTYGPHACMQVHHKAAGRDVAQDRVDGTVHSTKVDLRKGGRRQAHAGQPKLLPAALQQTLCKQGSIASRAHIHIYAYAFCPADSQPISRCSHLSMRCTVEISMMFPDRTRTLSSRGGAASGVRGSRSLALSASWPRQTAAGEQTEPCGLAPAATSAWQGF